MKMEAGGMTGKRSESRPILVLVCFLILKNLETSAARPASGNIEVLTYLRIRTAKRSECALWPGHLPHNEILLLRPHPHHDPYTLYTQVLTKVEACASVGVQNR